jgi:tRNA threonylcarbamoyladenosine biosynthesis protein TsaE
VEKTIPTIEALAQEAQHLIGTLTPKPERATLITLSGELGAGKTAFTKAIAAALGIEETVTSPTFVLEKIYDLPTSAFKKLIHIDAYRLTSGSELDALGFNEVLKDSHSLVILEWPERVADALPLADISIHIIPHTNGSRTFTYA